MGVENKPGKGKLWRKNPTTGRVYPDGNYGNGANDSIEESGVSGYFPKRLSKTPPVSKNRSTGSTWVAHVSEALEHNEPD